MFDKLSIRYKLLVLLGLSLGLGLLVSSLVALYSTFVAERQSSLQALSQVAAITSENMRAALAFQDAQSASKILQSLHTNPHLVYAWVEDDDGQLLGQYQGRTTSAQDAQAWRERLHAEMPLLLHKMAAEAAPQQAMERTHHYVIYPIDFEGRHIGTLAMLANNDAMYSKMWQFLGWQVLASLLIFVSLLLLSLRLQLIFTRPIEDLVASMQRIGRSKDYGTTLATHHTDEFGQLYRGLNNMLQEIRARDEKLSQLATTDALTQLANRGYALEALQMMATHAQREGAPLGVILLDIDYFKQVNDGYGHPAGDQVLRDMGHILNASIRPYDMAARFGGEEFLVLCAGANLVTAAEVAERIRAAVAAHVFDVGQGQTLRATVSLGVCARLTTPAQAVTLIEAADRALYRAKQAGRNRVEQMDDDAQQPA